jgi:hypothetical protein
VQNLVLPEANDRPPQFPQRTIDKAVSQDVLLYLSKPKFLVPFDFMLLFRPLVTVPEVAVAENRDTPRRKNKIRSPQHCSLLLGPQFGLAERLLQNPFEP